LLKVQGALPLLQTTRRYCVAISLFRDASEPAALGHNELRSNVQHLENRLPLIVQGAAVSYDKPVPEPDALSAPFWKSVRKHVLSIQRCAHCGRFEHPPVGVCQGCRSPDPRFEFTPVSGRGTLMSWTIMRDSFIPSFRGDIPFAIGLIELREQKGVRLIARLLDGATASYRVGAEVEVAFEDITPEASLPQFRLVKMEQS
jgi:uncharacterized OB-fold protein